MGAPMLTVESDSELDVDKLPQAWQKFSANRERFRKAARMKNNPRFTWLNYKNGGFGCILCASVGFDSQWASYSGLLKLSGIERHTETAQHVTADKMLGDSTTPSVYKAPSKSEFDEVWKKVRNGATDLSKHQK